MKVAKVYLKQRLFYLDHPYYYLVPDKAKIGQRGVFPYGKGNKDIEGVIFGFDNTVNRKLKEVKYLIDEIPLISEEQLKLNEFIKKNNFKFFYNSLKNFTEPIKTYKNSKGIIRSHKPKVDYQITLLEDKNVRGTLQKQIIEILKKSEIKFSELKKIFPKVTIKSLDRLKELGIISYKELEELEPVKTLQISKKEFLKLNNLENFIENVRNIINNSTGQTLIVFPNYFLAKQFHNYLNVVEIPNSLYQTNQKASENFEFYNNVRNGLIKVIISTSDGLFLNFNNLNNIIFTFVGDEIYSAGELKDFNSIEVVEKLAELNNSNILFVDFMDSLISFEKIEKGEWNDLIEESQSLKFNYSLDHIDIQDENSPIFSEILKEELKKNFKNKDKTLLVLNRKGYYGCIQCKKCHEPIRCPRCGSILKSVKGGKKVECRVCDFSGNFPDECSHCGSREFSNFQFGIERVLEEVKNLLPEANIALLLSNYESNLQDADIIVSTKKILYIPKISNIKSIGLILPDVDLYFPDYHAPESAFRFYLDLLNRYNDANIIIQSQNYTNSLLKAISGDETQFWSEQSEYRKLAKVPPYNDIYIINMMAENSKIINKEVKEFRELLTKIDGVTVLKAHVKRKGIPGWSKREFIIKDSDQGQLRNYLNQIINEGEFERFNSQISILVNPANIL